MIDKVLPGQRVTADTTNKMIEVCNGLQTPSESFVNTPNGTLTPVPGYQARYTYMPVPETVLQAKRGPAMKMTSRGATRAGDEWSQDEKEMTWLCFLGPDTAALTQCLPSSKTPDSIWLGNSDTALFAEVTDSMLSSLRPAGYYADLAAYGEDSVAVKEVKLTKSDDEEDPGKNVLVICGASLDDFGKIQEDSRYSDYDETEVVNTVLFAKINDQETVFQLPLKAEHSQQIDLVGDSQLSALELSSCVVRELSGKPFIELHEFHEDNTKNVSEVSADGVDVLIRNPRGPNDGRELQYVSLSSLLLSGTYIPPDADVPAAETSSLQTRDKDGTIVEEMFNFHLSDTVDISLDNLSAYDIVVRNPNDGRPYVQYGKLSIDIYPDSEGDSGQKSVAWLADQHELQLYKFDEDGLTSAVSTTVETNGNSERLVPDEYEFVFRKGGAGGEIEYGKVQLSVHADELSGDSQASEQKSISVENNIIQLYHMEMAGKTVSSEVPTHFDEAKTILSDDYEFVVRKGGAGGEIDYTTVKLRQAKLSVDSDTAGQKSVQYNPTSNELQLYKMHENGEAGHRVTITSALTSLLPSDYELVVRKNGAGGEIAYTKLSAVLSGGIELDTQATAQQKSLEWKTQNNRTYAQLYKMDAAGEATEQVDLKFAKDSYQDLLPDDEEFVIRSAQGGQIKYKNVGVCLSAYTKGGSVVSGDNEKTLSQKSIDLVFDGDDPDYYQLHDMDKAGTSLPKKAITMSADGYTPLLPSNYEFVLRQNGAGGTIKYANLSCCIPDLSALSATIVSGDNEVVGERKSIDFVNEAGSDPYYQLHNFEDSYVPGPNTFLKFQDQPLSGQDFSIGCQTEFVVRVPNGANGYEVKYMRLSAYQEHERVDTWTQNTQGQSIDYTTYDEGYGCYNVLELYNFRWGCSHFITSADISSEYGNGILIRKWDESGCCWQLDYMNFDSLDELAKKYIGDSQLSLSAHTPYRKSVDIYWDYDDNKYYVELWGFQTDYRTASVTIHNDGCTYYWPQDERTDQQLNEWDYILVKHVDANGNHTLQYKQFEVTMPDITAIESDINNIYGDINNFYDEINYLSGCIDDLSGHLSAGYWESGGDITTCYGSGIGDSNGNIVIDLDNHTCYSNYWWFQAIGGGGWFGGNNLQVEGIGDIQSLQLDHLGNGDGLTFASGCTHIHNSSSYFEGTVGVGCQLNIGCSYFSESSLRVGCTLTIGSTTIDEAQLSALLQLIS